MKCMYCDGEMEKRGSTYTIDRDRYHLFLEDVPAFICTQCGERYFEEEEVEAIQEMIRKVEEEIDKVRNYEKV